MQNKIADQLPILLWMSQQCKKSALLGLTLVLLSACSGAGQERDDPDAADGSNPTAAADDRPQAADLDPDLLFHALAAERLGAQGDYAEAFGHAYEAALLSDNTDLARQAVSLAMRISDWNGLTQASRRWLQLEPDSSAASQLVVLGLMNQGETDAAAREIAPRLRAASDSADAWREATLLMASAAQAEQALATMEALIARLPNTDAGQTLESRSLLLWQLGQAEEAFTLARSAAQETEDVDRLIWAAQLAAANDDYDAALGLYQRARTLDTDNAALALAEAEVLRQMDRVTDAIALLEAAPPSTSTLYTLGLYQYEQDALLAAERSWDRLASLDNPDDALEHAYLTGFLAELLTLETEALRWYEQVSEGENANRALLRRAGIQGRRGELMPARNLLRAVRLGDDGELIEQSWLTEADLLREAGRADECVEILTDVLREQPSSIWLLYSRSLCAVDADQLELAEQDLRRIIQIDGENAMALNALGYTLTDRTRRHSEALRLIERALELQPEDPATLDSMGWVLYRLGRLDEALGYLEQAWSLDRNPEIGAHLAEVRFYQGQRAAGLELIRELFETDPDHAVVADTHRRLMAEPE